MYPVLCVAAVPLNVQHGQDFRSLLHNAEVEMHRFDHPSYLFRGTVIYVLDMTSQTLPIPPPNTASDTSGSPSSRQQPIFNGSVRQPAPLQRLSSQLAHQQPNFSSSTRPPSQLSGQPPVLSYYGISQVAAAADFCAKAEHDRQVTNLKLQVRLHGGVVAEAMGQDITHVVLVDSSQSIGIGVRAAARSFPSSSSSSSAPTPARAPAAAARSAAAADEAPCKDDVGGAVECVGAAEFVSALVASCRDISKAQLRKMRGLLESGEVQVVGPRCVTWVRACVLKLKFLLIVHMHGTLKGSALCTNR